MASRSNPNLPIVTSTLPALALALANDLAGQIALNVGRYLTLGLEGAEDTHLAYSADLRSYEAFYAEHEFTPWPAAVPTLASYVAHLTDIPRKLVTINRHLAAIEKNPF